jgi:hypothetical protein
MTPVQAQRVREAKACVDCERCTTLAYSAASHLALNNAPRCLSCLAIVVAAAADRVPTDAVRALLAEQAADEGLWFIAQTAPEAYLQQELRRLHAVIEGEASVG